METTEEENIDNALAKQREEITKLKEEKKKCMICGKDNLAIVICPDCETKRNKKFYEAEQTAKVEVGK